MLLPTALFVSALALSPHSASTDLDYVTQHYDNLRTGWYQYETQLTTASVSSGKFGIVATLPVDGNVYAQALYVQDVNMSSGTHNVLIVATENDSVYAFDADSYVQLWHASFTNPSQGIGPAAGGRCKQIQPYVGVSSTPVIDPNSGTIYAVAKTQQTLGTKTTYANTLHALSLATGQDSVAPVLITGSVTLSNGKKDTFNQIERNRPGLLLANGNVYVGMGSNCDEKGLVVHGWMFAYHTPSLTPAGVFNTSVDVGSRKYLATIWQSTYGIAADQNGSVYYATGNGAFDADSGGGNYGDAVMRMSPGLAVQDWFRPYDLVVDNDNDLGSGGVMLLPPQSGSYPNMAVAAGKQKAIYLLNRDHLGGFTPSGPDNVLYEVPFTGGGVLGGPAYYADATGSYVYYARNGAPLTAYALTSVPTPQLTPTSSTSTIFECGGTIPAVSSNGQQSGSGIVWAVIRAQYRGAKTRPLTLAAYDADNLSQMIYSGGFDIWQNPSGHAMLTPTIANAKVYVGGWSSVTVFGLQGSARHRAHPAVPRPRSGQTPGRQAPP